MKEPNFSRKQYHHFFPAHIAFRLLILRKFDIKSQHQCPSIGDSDQRGLMI